MKEEEQNMYHIVTMEKGIQTEQALMRLNTIGGSI